MAAAAPAGSESRSPVRARRATSAGTGAIAIVVVEGDATALDAVLAEATGRAAPTVGSMMLRSLGGIDEGLVARLASDRAWLMPHGGRRIVERLREVLVSMGARWETDDDVAPPVRHPEAADRFEAEVLAMLSHAASPAAIPLLLDQPRRWRERAARGDAAPSFTAEDRARWARLDRLIDPPRVCVVGPPNAGKSTLANTLAGREVAIASPLAGTTRDFVATRIDLAGLVVEWIDLPGFFEDDAATPSPIDRAAGELAAGLATAADLIVLLAAPDQAWAAVPSGATAERLRVMSKSDLDRAAESPRAAEADHSISAATGEGMPALASLVRDTLVPPSDLRHPGPWRWRSTPVDAKSDVECGTD